MNKNKFLESLRKKLSILEESEIEDIITEYDGYIEEKIAEGSSEEDAVKSMGNIDELARDLLSAYKIKDPNEKVHDGINNIVDSFMNVIDRIISVFAHKSFNDIVKFIIELIFIFIIIAICKIPFDIIENMGRSIFASFGSYPGHAMNVIWNFILEIAYLIFAILLFIKIFESRYLNEEFTSVFHEEKKDREENIREDENKKEKVKKEKVSKEPKEDKYIKKEYHERRNFGIIDALSKVCIFFIKFILLFVIFGVGCYLVGMAVVLGIAIYFLIKGVFYFGIYLILIALFILGIVAFIFLFNFIFDHKNKTGILLVTMLVSFGILGVGTGICALEFASTTIVYTENNDNLNTQEFEFEFEMKDNLILSQNVFYGDNVIVDNTLGNKIKVVYIYNDKYIKITPNPFISDNHGSYEILHPGYRVSEFKYSKEIFDEFISDLKDKKIFINAYGDVDIKVYVSSDVKSKLEENERKYSKRYNYRDLEDICDELRELDLTLPDYCKVYDDGEEM